MNDLPCGFCSDSLRVSKYNFWASSPTGVQKKRLQKGIHSSMLKQLLKNLDPWSLVVVGLTFILFFTALFIKGFTHDMLLEAGVFLVSVKLIIMSHKQAAHTATMEEKLEEISHAIRSQGGPGSQ
jgi:cadmium resistance protein CadD (predicted permease)